MSNFNQKNGFMDTTLIIALVLIVGVGGFVFWRLNDTDENLPKANNFSEASNTEPTSNSGDEPTEKARTLLDVESINFSITYPENWIIASSASEVGGEAAEFRELLSEEVQLDPDASRPMAMNIYFRVFIEEVHSRSENLKPDELKLFKELTTSSGQNIAVFKRSINAAANQDKYYILNPDKTRLTSSTGSELSLSAEFNGQQADYNFITTNFPDFDADERPEVKELIRIAESIEI